MHFLLFLLWISYARSNIKFIFFCYHHHHHHWQKPSSFAIECKINICLSYDCQQWVTQLSIFFINFTDIYSADPRILQIHIYKSTTFVVITCKTCLLTIDTKRCILCIVIIYITVCLTKILSQTFKNKNIIPAQKNIIASLLFLYLLGLLLILDDNFVCVYLFPLWIFSRDKWHCGKDVCLESASVWNHQQIAGSIPTTGKITKNTFYRLTLVSDHG